MVIDMELYRIIGPVPGAPAVYDPVTEATLQESWRAIKLWATETIVTPSGINEEGKPGKLFKVVAAPPNAPLSIRTRTLPIRIPEEWVRPEASVSYLINASAEGWNLVKEPDGTTRIVCVQCDAPPFLFR